MTEDLKFLDALHKTAPNLACGHPIKPSEILRYGPEAWCWVCCKWQWKDGS